MVDVENIVVELPAMIAKTKSYLGDAVYVQLDEGGRIVLTTEDGYNAYNTIVLEPEVWAAMKAWVQRHS